MQKSCKLRLNYCLAVSEEEDHGHRGISAPLCRRHASFIPDAADCIYGRVQGIEIPWFSPPPLQSRICLRSNICDISSWNNSTSEPVRQHERAEGRTRQSRAWQTHNRQKQRSSLPHPRNFNTTHGLRHSCKQADLCIWQQGVTPTELQPGAASQATASRCVTWREDLRLQSQCRPALPHPGSRNCGGWHEVLEQEHARADDGLPLV